MKLSSLITTAAIFLFAMAHAKLLPPCSLDLNATSNKCGYIPCRFFTECQSLACNIVTYTCDACNNDESGYDRCESLNCYGGN